MIQPSRPLGADNLKLPDEDLIASLDDHDQEVGHHITVDEPKEHHHDILQGSVEAVPEEVVVIHGEAADIDTKRKDQSEVEWIQEPAATEDNSLAPRIDLEIHLRITSRNSAAFS